MYIFKFKILYIFILTLTYNEFKTVVERENESNKTFDIGHLYSKNQTAIKAHYLMIQIAHILRQLLENGVKEIKGLKMKLKEIS